MASKQEPSSCYLHDLNIDGSESVTDGRDEIEAAMDAIVLNVLPIQTRFVLKRKNGGETGMIWTLKRLFFVHAFLDLLCWISFFVFKLSSSSKPFLTSFSVPLRRHPDRIPH